MVEIPTPRWVHARTADADPLEVLERFEQRVDRINPLINAVCCRTPEVARADATALASREDRRDLPLAGMVVMVKDNMDVAGYPTSVGSPIFADTPVDRDAEVVRRLREAGALLLGKTLLHEFAYGVTSKNRHFGYGRNPWNREHIPGGSSGGSGAAVAADLCVAALGSDTGGSVRVPASLNGVTGLRPTYGSVSNRGVFPISPTFDMAGPLARSMEDVWAAFEVLRGYDSLDPWAVAPPMAPLPPGDTGTLDGLTIGLPEDAFWQDADAEILEAVDAGVRDLQRLGAAVRPVSIAGAQEARDDCNAIILAEALELHEERLATVPEQIDPEIRERLELGRAVTGTQFARALRSMLEWRVRVLECLSTVDVIVVPTTRKVAPDIASATTIETTRDLTWFAYPWSLARVPAASLPCGFSSSGLPIGMQVVAAHWREDQLARVGIAYQRETDWHLRRPPLNET